MKNKIICPNTGHQVHQVTVKIDFDLNAKRGADPNNTCSSGATPLHMLIWVNRTETLLPMASLLIQYGADVNARQENDENPLHS